MSRNGFKWLYLQLGYPSVVSKEEKNPSSKGKSRPRLFQAETNKSEITMLLYQNVLVTYTTSIVHSVILYDPQYEITINNSNSVKSHDSDLLAPASLQKLSHLHGRIDQKNQLP